MADEYEQFEFFELDHNFTNSEVRNCRRIIAQKSTENILLTS